MLIGRASTKRSRRKATPSSRTVTASLNGRDFGSATDQWAATRVDDLVGTIEAKVKADRLAFIALVVDPNPVTGQDHIVKVKGRHATAFELRCPIGRDRISPRQGHTLATA